MLIARKQCYHSRGKAARSLAPSILRGRNAAKTKLLIKSCDGYGSVDSKVMPT
jgi:hypothetical protein